MTRWQHVPGFGQHRTILHQQQRTRIEDHILQHVMPGRSGQFRIPEPHAVFALQRLVQPGLASNVKDLGRFDPAYFGGGGRDRAGAQVGFSFESGHATLVTETPAVVSMQASAANCSLHQTSA